MNQVDSAVTDMGVGCGWVSDCGLVGYLDYTVARVHDKTHCYPTRAQAMICPTPGTSNLLRKDELSCP